MSWFLIRFTNVSSHGWWDLAISECFVINEAESRTDASFHNLFLKNGSIWILWTAPAKSLQFDNITQDFLIDQNPFYIFLYLQVKPSTNKIFEPLLDWTGFYNNCWRDSFKSFNTDPTRVSSPTARNNIEQFLQGFQQKFYWRYN